MGRNLKDDSDRTLNSQTKIAPLQLPESDRTPSNSPKAIALPQPPKKRSHSLTPQKAIASPPLPKQRSHPFNSPTSFFNEPRRHEEHEGRREERAIA